MSIVKSFAPVIKRDCRVLVLGSMPGRKSLAENQYYAHKQNLFWKFLYKISGKELDYVYKNRLRLLLSHKVALWDVLKACERKSSLDSDIVIASEQVNDIPALLEKYEHIAKICFNGQKAYTSFERHILARNPDIQKNYELVILPSTSPANASISFEEKLKTWKKEVYEL
ncbi:MAG: DNA-deoxyinosine glycosylase [Candidatus Rifleibacteriota bacterium]